MHIELRHLELVQAVAEHRTLTNAALQLHLTQSALSHQLRELEARLGVRLFDRKARGMSLTPAGEQLRLAAASVLGQLKALEQRVVLAGRTEPLRLRLTTECYTCYHWLTDIIRGLRAAFPEVEPSVEAAATQQPLTALAAQQVDLAVMSSDVSDPRFVALPLFDDELLVLVDPAHRWARRKHVELEELRTETIFLYGPKEHSRVLNDSLIPAGVTASQVKELQLTEAIVAMVRAGLGIGILARWAIQPEIVRGELRGLPVVPERIERSWKAVVPRGIAGEPHITEFVRLARQLAPSLRGDEPRVVRFARSRK
jgi:LysR family transcriptional regulator, regulator for metE and metH